MRKYLLPAAIGWTLLIAVLCLVSFRKLPSIGIGGADKYIHVVFHFGFFVLWFLNFRRPDNFDKMMARVFLASLLYGIAIEVAQELFTATRHADLYDVMANTTGAFLAIAVIMIANYYHKRK
ncbi:MAG TPA: VanZ family protein [Flavobacterium sp.]|nr:VanZ family protein [Flavobacterium sp.]HPJ10857.1 VanZ family protein [Flavobacterium sp.]